MDDFLARDDDEMMEAEELLMEPEDVPMEEFEPEPELEAMTEEELVALIDQELNDSQGSETGRLNEVRGKAMDYYLGEPYGNEESDQSQVVTREVLDTIEWIKPELLKLFASGDETVRFEPQGPQDVEAAQQATDYINYLFHRKNPGFRILYEWITDGLLQKNGVVKVYWDPGTPVREEYEDLTDQELQALASLEEVEILEHQPGVVQTPMGPQVSHKVAIARNNADGGLKVEVIPPEEFHISRGAKCVAEAACVAHISTKTLSDIRKMGYDIDADEVPSNSRRDGHYTDEYRARFKNDDTGKDAWDNMSGDPTMEEVDLEEAYIRADFNGDGIAELRKVLKVGSLVLENEEVDFPPFAAWTPIIMSHKFYGLSLADLVMDLQKIQSQLFRNYLDNQYLTNHGRWTVVEGMVNLGDMLVSRPGGVVRTKMAGAVSRLDTPQLGPSAIQSMEYVDRLREKRTGVSERSAGLDPKALNPNTAATAVNQVMTAAQQRIELIARVFGETGLTDLFRLMYKLVLQNQKTQDIFRLRDNYISVNPSEWRDRKDVSVVVGLGNGSKESEMMMMNMIVQSQF